jgi:multiple sugar transport system substrate-binding protein
MSMVKPRNKVLASLAAAALLISACGADSAPDATPGTSGSTPPAAGEVITITMQHMETPPNRVDAFQVAIDGFNASQSRFRVEQQTVGWGEAYPRAVSQIQAGQQPDLLQAIPAFFTTIRETGAVIPATSVYSQLAQRHNFIDAYTAQYEWDGEVWAIPAFGMLEGLWYNQEHFDAVGITAPSTWDEMLAAAEALTTDGRFGVAIPTGDSFATLQAIYTWMGAAGAADIYDDQCNVIVDNPNTVAAFDFYRQLAAFSPPDSASYAWAEVEGALVSQRASMITFKGSFLNAWQNDSGLTESELAMTRIPQPATGGRDFTLSYSNAFMVLNEDPQVQEGIVEFLDYFLQPANYGTWLGTAEPGLFLPVTEPEGDFNEFWAQPIIADFEEEMRRQIDMSEVAQLYGFTQQGYCSAVGEFEGQLLLGKAVERMIVLGDTPQEAVTWLAGQMEALS